ncbi:MAG: rRNA maturation RNase YbeY [Candidatus Omnitrophica bacterium]|nr:rRNA maturation RNase YbeY [Candidatus Omnitrophota bacterium]
MEIAFENLQKKVTLNPPQILKTAATILRHEGVDNVSLSIVFVSRQRIQALNKKFLGRDYATDVLAFNLSERRGTVPAFRRGKRRAPTVRNARQIAGDIIISTDAVVKNARIYKTGLSEELALYVIHGILHLLGFDDHKTRDIQRMRKKEQQLLMFLGITTKKLIRHNK